MTGVRCLFLQLIENNTLKDMGQSQYQSTVKETELININFLHVSTD